MNRLNIEMNTEKQEHPMLEFIVPAGFPSPARDYIEDNLNLNDLIIKNSTSTYFMRVKGYSMSDANIFPNDILVIDRAIDPTDKKIVIAVVDGEFTVKRLKIRNNEYWLIPENVNYPDLKIEEWMNFSIWGVVTYIIHRAI